MFQPNKVGFKRRTHHYYIFIAFITGVFCLLIPSVFNGQSLSEKQRQCILLTIANQFGDAEAENTMIVPGPADFCRIGSDTLYNPNGYLYVFKLKMDSCIRIDKSMFHGFNFYRNLFTYANEMYALGGYGGFRSNNLLIKFNLASKDWHYVHCTGEAPPDVLGVSIIKNDTLFSFANLKPGNSVVPDEPDTCVYALDLKNKHWTKLPFYCTVGKIETQKFFVVNDFLIWIKGYYTVIVYVPDMEMIRVDNEQCRLDRHSFLDSIINDNTASFGNDLARRSNFISQKINLIQIWQDKRFKHEPLFSDPPTKDKASYLKYIIIIIFIIAVIGVIVYFARHRASSLSEVIDLSAQIKDVPKSLRYQDQLASKLSKIAPATLNIEQLDEIFEISHLSFDSKKLKRHRLIKELNSEWPDLIRRERSAEDQRQFIYKIKELT